MITGLLAQLKVLLASLATVALSITPAIQQGVQTYTNNTAPNVSSSNGNSRNWAGYVANSASYTAVSGTWTVPQPTSNGHTATDATWVGIGGVNSNDLLQSGTQNVVSPSGQVTTTAFYELLPAESTQITSLTVKPGDSVTVSITQQSSEQWLINFNDNTSNQNYQTTVAYNSSLSSAEWIEEAPSNGVSVLPLDNFGTIQFTNSSITQDGSQISVTGANAHAVTMVNEQGQNLATSSALGSDGESFSITRSTAESFAPIPSFDRNPGSFRRHGRGIGPHNFYQFHFPTPTIQVSTVVSPQPSITPQPTVQSLGTVRVFQFHHSVRFGWHHF